MVPTPTAAALATSRMVVFPGTASIFLPGHGLDFWLRWVETHGHSFLGKFNIEMMEATALRHFRRNLELL
jgi:hypothetical protein